MSELDQMDKYGLLDNRNTIFVKINKGDEPEAVKLLKNAGISSRVMCNVDRIFCEDLAEEELARHVEKLDGKEARKFILANIEEVAENLFDDLDKIVDYNTANETVESLVDGMIDDVVFDETVINCDSCKTDSCVNDDDDYGILNGERKLQNVEVIDDEATEQLDFLHNTAYEFINTLAQSTGEGEVPWDIETIREVTDMVVSKLAAAKRKIWYPGISE